MDTRREVALFVDFENIRDGILKTYGVELDPSLLIDKARKYGLVNIARAYGDFDRMPAELQRQMQVCGLVAISARSHLVGDRRHSAADLDLLLDLIETMLDRSGIPTVVLMSGDRDFLRVVTMARNRFGKEIIISGVPGTVSTDLIDAAGGNFDPLEVPGVERRVTTETAAAGNGAPTTLAPPTTPAPAEIERRERPEPRENRQRVETGERRGGSVAARQDRSRSSYGRRPTRSTSGMPTPSAPKLPQPDVEEELAAEQPTGDGPVPTWQRGKLAERAEAIQRMMDERRAAGEDVPAGWTGQPTWKVGDEVEGVVKSITDFGAFLDVGGVDALLHVSQMAWQHVRHPSQIVQMGISLKVRVLELDEASGRVSVGLKQLTPDPWLTAADKYELGSVVRGRVSGVKEYGVFVELEPGIFGLLHISNIFAQPWGHHPSERFRLDQEVEVSVSKIDPEMRRLAFVLPGSPIGEESGGEAPTEIPADIPADISADIPAAVERNLEEDDEAAEAALLFREGEETDG